MASVYKTIVIADDDEDDLDLFKEATAEICPDINITIATDGARLLKLLEEISKPDVIILDLNMPCKSGKEYIDEIRAKVEFRDVPIVVLSTSNIQNDIRECIEKGANHYYMKPQSFEGMKTIVANICDGKIGNAI